ncbi:Alpha-crystallin B chain, partial [Pseudolycoriella hygida]
MSAKGNCNKLADGTIVYKTVSKTGSAPAELDSTKWYMDKCEIVGYRSEHLTITINGDGIIRVDGDYNDGKASRSFFNEYIIPDGVNYEAMEFRIYENDQNTLVIVGAIGGEIESLSTHQQEQATIKRTEDVRISSKFTETIESTELEGSEDMSKEIRVVDNKFEAKVNVSEYKTEEINVKISRKIVLIYTSRKEVTKTTTRKEIKKIFEIPNGVKPESITSVVGKDGNLTVSAVVDEKLARQQNEVQETNKTSTTTTSNTIIHQIQQEKNQVKQETTSKELVQHQQQLQQINTNEVVIRIRTVNTNKNITGEDLKDVKIVKDRFEMNIDVRDFKLEEVIVKIIKSRRVITISANHKSQYESRSTYREFTLPDGTPDSNPNVIDAVLNSNGILTITGPCTPAALTDTTDDISKTVAKQQQNTSVQQQQQNTVQQQQKTTVVQQQQQNTSVQQKQQNTSVQQNQQNTSVQQKQQNTSVQKLEDTSVQQHQSQQQIVQQSRYTKITRETFTSSTMTSLDVQEADGSIEEYLISEPNTPIDDVTQDVVEDEDGNLIVELDVKDYRAEDITVKASKTTITVILRKNDDVTVCKTIHVPVDVVITPDTIRSILEKSRGVLILMIVRKKTTNTTKEIVSDRTDEQRRIDNLQQQQQQKQLVEQRQQTVQETQTKTQTQQQKVIQQKQESVEKQESIEETQTRIQTQQQSATKQLYTGDPKFFERTTQIVDYKPEELEVKIAMPWVIIEGKQEMTAENGWRIPEGVKQENIQLELNDAGDVVNCTALIG